MVDGVVGSDSVSGSEGAGGLGEGVGFEEVSALISVFGFDVTFDCWKL